MGKAVVEVFVDESGRAGEAVGEFGVKMWDGKCGDRQDVLSSPRIY